VADSFATLASDGSYGDFEYRAMMRRSGCETCANGLLIRGTPNPLQVYNRWNTDYAFLFTRNGSISVWKRIGDYETALLPWTASEAVYTSGNWNTLRVVVEGDRIFYYLNDKLVWSGRDADYSFGKVGITMFRSSSSVGDLLEVDWAILAGGTPLTLFKDSFEHGLEYWSYGATSGSNAWYHEYGYATSGDYMLYAYNQPAVADIYARTKNAVNLPAGQNAYLHFRHAYDFESGFDGGVIEYSTSGGSVWADAGLLAVNNGYNGTLSSSFSNPLGGRSAFTGSSSGYIATRINLTSQAGNPLLLRFRVGTDTSVDDLGWLIDDVQVYTCLNRLQTIHLPMLVREQTTLGFNSQFNDSSSGWQSAGGAWRLDSMAVVGDGLPNGWASMYYWQPFTNLDFTVRMGREGCSTCANRITIRGAVDPLISEHNWSSYYAFQYTNGGSFSVFKRVGGGSSIALQGWTPSAAIVQGGYNTLRVVANDGNLYYYINGTLVWSGSDSSLTSGLVGFGLYRDMYSSNNALVVDYATLAGASAALEQALFIPEQAPAALPGGSEEMSP